MPSQPARRSINSAPHPFLLFAAILGLLAVVIGRHYAWALENVAPIHDASNCISRASNLGLMLWRGQWADFATNLGAEKNNFLSILYFSLWNALSGPGRLAWAPAWIVAAAVWMRVSYRWSQSSPVVTAHQFVWALLALPLLSRTGGFLDQRFDLFAVLVLCLVAQSLVRGHLRWALGLSLTAVLAKGPAVPVACVVWLAAALAGFVDAKSLRELRRASWRFWLPFVASALAYVYFNLLEVVRYNLMALNAKPAGPAQGPSALRQTLHVLSHEKGAYLRFMNEFSPLPAVIFFAVTAWVAWTYWGRGSRTRSSWQSPDRRVAVFGLCATLGTYALFSAHPVKGPVLMIWLVPGLWILCGVAAAWSAGERGPLRWRAVLARPRVALGVALAGLVAVAVANERRNYRAEIYVMSAQEKTALAQLRLIAAKIGESAVASGRRIECVLPNFLYPISQRLGLNYDALRVLAFERGGRAMPRLEGWELGTFSGDWAAEMPRLEACDGFAFVLARNPPALAHPVRQGREVALSVEIAAGRCDVAPALETSLEYLGATAVYELGAAQEKCILRSPGD